MTTPAPVTTISRDFVFLGVRYATVKGKKDPVKAACLAPINQVADSSLLEEDMLIKWDRDWERRIIGGIYRGAEFGFNSEAQTSTFRGAKAITYVGNWPDAQARIEWQALSTLETKEAQTRAELAKTEKGGKDALYTDQMILLRGAYQNCRNYTKRAMEEAVQIALRTPLTKAEQATYDAWLLKQNTSAKRKAR